MAAPTIPSPDFFARSQLKSDAIRAPLTTTPTDNTAIAAGWYLLMFDGATNFRFKMGAAGVAITASTGNLLPTQSLLGPVYFDGTECSRYAAMAISGSGTLEFIAVT